MRMTTTAPAGTAKISPLMPVYARADIYFERGEGCYLYDDKGERYLDFIGGIAVTALGHAHPYLIKALKAQAEKLWITSNIFNSHGGDRLAQRLVDMTFADTVFFQNSGAEAWECSMKVARKYQSAVGQPQRYRMICFEGCFHGRTLAAIAAAKTDKMVKGFGPMMSGFDQVSWGNIDAVKAAITQETAGIVIEPVQGDGGMKSCSTEFLRQLRTICDQNGLMLVFDEVQCGMGRTGKFFAHEWAEVKPDIMSVAKALGNGYPIGACLATAKAAQGMVVGTHGSTYGGNPIAVAVGNAVLDVITAPGFLDAVQRTGAYFGKQLESLRHKHPTVFREVRGKGLMRGLVCGPENLTIIRALRAEKLLALGAGDNVIRFLPALIVTESQIDDAIAIIDCVARTFA